jgi:diguanylate cyclase (GGDEF)-like protein
MNSMSMIDLYKAGIQTSTILCSCGTPNRALVHAAVNLLNILSPLIDRVKIYTRHKDEQFLREEVEASHKDVLRGNDLLPVAQIEDRVGVSGYPVSWKNGNEFETCIPLIAEERLSGLLVLVSASDLSETMFPGLEMLGEALQHGIKYLFLMRDADRYKGLERIADRIGSELIAFMEAEQLVRLFVQRVVEMFGVDRVTLFLFNGETGDIVRTISALYGSSLFDGVVHPPLEVHIRESVLQQDFPGVLIPFNIGNRYLGTVMVDNLITLQPISEDMVEVLTKLTRHIALAYENAVLFNRLKETAIRDDLTNLLRPGYFFEKLSEALVVHDNLSLITIDLDRFKHINDTYGHPCGDKVIVQAAALIKEFLGKDDLACRMGGDEFILLMPGKTAKHSYTLIAELLKCFAEKRFLLDGESSIEVSFSAGISVYPEDGIEMQDLLRKSDNALYMSKRRGRGLISTV